MTSETARGVDESVACDGGHPDSARWYLAATIEERLRAGAPSGEVDHARGARRLQVWREEPILASDESHLDSYLDVLGLDIEGAITMLGELPETVRSRFSQPPGYLERIHRAYLSDTERQATHIPHTFTALAAPLLADGAARISTAVDDLVSAMPSRHIDADILVARLVDPPTETVASVLDKTMVLELNVLRAGGELTGDDPHARLHGFLWRLRDPGYVLGVFEEYPVLARDLVQVVENWVSTRIEFAERLVTDIGVLTDLVTGQGVRTAALGVVHTVDFGAGDSHRGGRSVATVGFDSGPTVIYKPRSLGVEQHFQHLLDWLNERGAEPPLRTMRVLDRGAYGWAEFVVAQDCDDPAGVRRFYRRQGILLALLHALTATDFHWENLIAAGEHPMLIDLEALFHPAREPVESPEVPAHAQRAVLESVLNVGLLPRPTIFNEDREVDGVDMSGIGGHEGQWTPSKVPSWNGLGTDRIHLVRQRHEMRPWSNRPTVAGEAASALDHGEEIVTGYESGYQLLARNAQELLARGGPIEMFAGDEIRVLLRPTAIYARILQEGHHPDLLRDQLDRQRFYSCLSARDQWQAHQAELTSAELTQILAGDIPMFTSTPDGVDLIAGDGAVGTGSVISGVLPTSGLQRCRERIATLSEHDLKQQVWFIRSSLAALSMGDGGGRPEPRTVPLALGPAPAADFVSSAAAVADTVLDTAIVENDKITWLGVTLVADRVWTVGPVSDDVYNGISGIALFLGYLAEVTGEPRYHDAVDKVTGSLLRQPDRARSRFVGTFHGLSGPIYALSHLAALSGRADVADAAVAMATRLPQLANDEHVLDLVSGSAGAILALLACHAVTGQQGMLDIADSFASRLVEVAVPLGGGYGWRGSLDPDVALVGVSHGASGVALALARLDTARGEHRHVDLVLGACDYERSLFDERGGNWPDLRTLNVDGSSMLAWCHGAPGIGLVRAELLGYLTEAGMDTADIRADLRHAADAMVRAKRHDGFTGVGNHSLCHGDLGNLTCLTAVAEALDEQRLRVTADLFAATVLADATRSGWVCGVPLGVATPGLLTGLSGIGLGLLHHAYPDRVPSVLAVAPPRAT